jgi:hypothetical protein
MSDECGPVRYMEWYLKKERTTPTAASLRSTPALTLQVIVKYTKSIIFEPSLSYFDWLYRYLDSLSVSGVSRLKL